MISHISIRFAFATSIFVRQTTPFSLSRPLCVADSSLPKLRSSRSLMMNGLTIQMNRGVGDSRRQKSNGSRSRRPRTPPPPIPPPGKPGRECFRDLVIIDNEVWVVKKENQRARIETRGTVMRHLTKSPYHPRGIKVMLSSGEVGRVTRFLSDE